MQRIKYRETGLKIILMLIFLSAFHFYFLSTATAQQKGEVEEELREVKAGELAPLFVMHDLEGRYFSLKNYCDLDDTGIPPALRKQKSVVIINFFSTICIPCVEELPALLRIYEKYKDRGLKMFLISIDGKPEEVLPPFIEKYNITVPVLLDMYQKTLNRYGFNSVPHTILIDRNRRILAVFKEDKELEKKLDEKLSLLLNK